MYWRQVLERGFDVPVDRPLDDLTAELTQLLGSTDPSTRDDVAYATLATWISRGVYDELLSGLGDGIVPGLGTDLGAVESDSVFRRSYSALVIAECVARDNAAGLMSGRTIMRWGDCLASWYTREADHRGYVPGKGWAHAIAHGADAFAMLAESRHLRRPELVVLLDVLADRILDRRTDRLGDGETDRIAAAVLNVFRRDEIELKIIEPWIQRLASGASDRRGVVNHYDRTANPESLLRSIYVQLALSERPPAQRGDILLAVVDALRVTNAAFLSAGTTAAR